MITSSTARTNLKHHPD